MPDHKLCVPCLFGLEGPLGNELRHMGLRDVMPENGRVRCTGTDADIARMNIRCRFGERVLLELGSFPAPTFDALFEGVKALPWADYLPADAAFPVKGYSLESALHSVPDCQKIIKKAVVESLKRRYRVGWFAETGALYQIQFSLVHDTATLYLDTTGTPLHKRGYRKVANLAPIRETLAAGILDIARIYPDTQLYDPFCGSGTFLIEAAYKAKNIAPGIYRRFAAEKWDCLPSKIWQKSREEAIEKIRKYIEFIAFGSDNSQDSLEIAEANARRAGISGLIRLEKADVKNFTIPDRKSLVVTNPPYGERLMNGEDLTKLYQTMGNVFQPSQQTAYYIISSAENFEQSFGRKADKKRKLYNGMLKCNLYQYFAQKSK